MDGRLPLLVVDVTLYNRRREFDDLFRTDVQRQLVPIPHLILYTYDFKAESFIRKTCFVNVNWFTRVRNTVDTAN